MEHVLARAATCNWTSGNFHFTSTVTASIIYWMQWRLETISTIC